MGLSDYYELADIPLDKEYRLAQDGIGFVIPGPAFLTSISPPIPIQYVALLRYKIGETRANHYHKCKVEYLVVLDGELTCQLYLPDHPSEQSSLKLVAGKLLKIAPGCVHIITAVTETAAMLEMSPQKLDLSDQISVISTK